MSLPDAARTTLDELVDGLPDALGAAPLGVHVVGAHALGSADGRSDVDVVVVTDGRPDDAARSRLAALHTRLLGSPGRAARLEVAYADRADLRSPMTLGRRWPHVAAGSGEVVDSARADTAHGRWVLRERAVTLAGADPREVVADIGPDALRAEALGLARARGEELEQDPAVLAEERSQATWVLTSCRVLHTATHAEVVGAPDAARWALAHLDPGHHEVVTAALAERAGPADAVPRPSDPALVAATRALVWDVVRLAGQAALEARPGGS